MPADLGALERQVIHQALLIEDESDDWACDAVGVDRTADPDSDNGDRTVDAHLPAVRRLELRERLLIHEHDDHRARLRAQLKADRARNDIVIADCLAADVQRPFPIFAADPESQPSPRLGTRVSPLPDLRARAGKLPTIGFLGADASSWSRWTAAFVERMPKLGWIGIAGMRDALSAAPRSQPSLSGCKNCGTPRDNNVDFHALKRETSTIPIVFTMSSDPVGAGLVASLARPGGNVTGLSLQQSDLAGKRLELLREVIPKLRRLDFGQCRLSRAGT
jgi:hypothetical protein